MFSGMVGISVTENYGFTEYTFRPVQISTPRAVMVEARAHGRGPAARSANSCATEIARHAIPSLAISALHKRSGSSRYSYALQHTNSFLLKRTKHAYLIAHAHEASRARTNKWVNEEDGQSRDARAGARRAAPPAELAPADTIFYTFRVLVLCHILTDFFTQMTQEISIRP
ncbi:hypothetical protein EVAR_75820_1 [Eumeta japonica]|uniref:Uncharacterized protein n=1 Tax=Eumeta variegata TaxID=151549 RepID=A0A4C1TGH0_EUMVA|nr:hypothetical protein EVAR_75820_1 [Eumeta japonica]